MGIKNIVHEVAGISENSRAWVDVVYDRIEQHLTNPSNDHEGNTMGDFLIVHGKQYPEQYKKFPIDRLEILYVASGGSYDPMDSGYMWDGRYRVVIRVSLKKGIIAHELKHAYEDYLRISKKYGQIHTSKDNFASSGKFHSAVSPRRSGLGDSFRYMLWAFYYLSKPEQNAYMDNFYEDDEAALGMEKMLNGIIQFDFDRLYYEITDSEWDVFKKSNTPFLSKFKSKHEFVEYAKKVLPHKAKKYKKKVNKMKYIHGKLKESVELSEVAGISENSRAWVDIIYNEITDFYADDEKVDYTMTKYGPKIYIDGRSYREAYEKFPVDKFIIFVNTKNDGGGYYKSSGMKGEGYIVTLRLPLRKGVIAHELRHAYEDFMIYRTNPLHKQEDTVGLALGSSSILTDSRLKTSRLYKILYFYYFLSKEERSAFLENFYEGDIHGQRAANVLNVILKFDFSRDLDDWEWELLEGMNIRQFKKFRNSREFMKYSEFHLKHKARQFKKKIDKMKYLHGR